jgi:hypothetical protein
MHPLTLRFEGVLEDEFAQEYSARTLSQVRSGLVLGIILYTVFGILDTWIAPAQRESLWLIRYAIVVPLFGAVLWFTYHHSFTRYREPVVSFAVMVAALGIVAMTAIIPAPGNYLYYAGLILVIIFAFTLMRLGLPFSLGISAVTIAGYLGVAFSAPRTPTELIVNNMFFLGATVVLGFSANYSMAKYARTVFLQRRLIEADTRQLQETNQELMAKNQMLAESRAATLRTAQRSELIVNNMFFLGATVVLGFSANYSMAKYARTVFLQRRLIEAHTTQLLETNQELMTKNRMLAESRAATIRTAQRSELIFSALSETLPGTVLDEKYRLAEKIGSGNFGTVYRGEHIFLHHPVAVKVFRPAIGQVAQEGLERFRLEGISACRINHPNAVTVLDFDVSAGSLAYLVMELLHGRSLAEELKAVGRISPVRCASIAASVCDALAEAHAAGIVHRDIKPGNVFLDDSHEEQLVKVIDFGIAKLTDTSALKDNMQVSTIAGSFAGTPAYMAPERLLDERYDGRADVYSVGVMMYEMLAGHVPFISADAGSWSLARKHIVEEPASLRAGDAGVPQELEAIVFDALAKTAAERPTAAQLGARLHDFLIKASLQPN